MSQMIEECKARAIRADWSPDTTKDYDIWALARVWADSRKGQLRILSDALEFSDWNIPYTDIDHAVLTLIQGITPAYILRIKAKGESYQFSIGGGSHFRGELPFPVRREVTKGFTWLKAVTRVLLVAAMLGLLLWSSRR